MNVPFLLYIVEQIEILVDDVDGPLVGEVVIVQVRRRQSDPAASLLIVAEILLVVYGQTPHEVIYGADVADTATKQ